MSVPPVARRARAGRHVDPTAPPVSIVGPADDSWTHDATPTFTGTAGTTIDDLDIVTIEVYSGTSVSDAIRGAVERASQTLDDLQWFEVKEIRGRIAEGEIAEYQVKLDVSFLLHAPEKRTTPGKGGTQTTRGARTTKAQVAAKRGDRRRTDVARGFRQQPGR